MLLCRNDTIFLVPGKMPMKEKKNGLEQDIINGLERAIQYLATHFRLFLNLLVHPSKTLSEKFANTVDKFAFTFWFLNICIVYWFGKVFGFTPNKYPFTIPFPFHIPFLDLIDNFFLIFARHIIGLIIFCGLFRFFIGSKESKVIKRKVDRLFFLSSAIFLPFCLFQVCLWRLFLDKYFNGMADPLLRTMQYFILTGKEPWVSAINFFINFLKGYLVFFTLNSFFVIWWLWFMWTGIKFIQVRNVLMNRIFLKVCLLFIIIQATTSSIFAITSLIHGIKPYSIIALKEVEKAVTRQPPNYGEAAKLCDEVVKNKYSPIYFKYVATVRGLVYKIASFSFIPSTNKFTELILNETSGWEWRGDYRKIQLKIDSYFEQKFSKEKNVERSMENLLCQIKERLAKAEELYSNKDFNFEEEQKAETVSLGIGCCHTNEEITYFYPLKKDGNKMKIKDLGVIINICAWGKIFSIFPDFSLSDF